MVFLLLYSVNFLFVYISYKHSCFKKNVAYLRIGCVCTHILVIFDGQCWTSKIQYEKENLKKMIPYPPREEKCDP